MRRATSAFEVVGRLPPRLPNDDRAHLRQVGCPQDDPHMQIAEGLEQLGILPRVTLGDLYSRRSMVSGPPADPTARKPTRSYRPRAWLSRATLRLSVARPSLRACATRELRSREPIPCLRRDSATPMPTSGVLASTKPKPGSLAGRNRNQAAPTGCSSSAMTPQSPGCGHPTT